MSKKLISALSMSLSFILLTSLSLAHEKDVQYVFRNDVRPEYKNTITQDQFSKIQKNTNVTIIDVRLTEDFALDPILIPGAEYKNPEKISSWADTIPKGKKVVLYCVKGAWVSHKAATYLTKKGYDVMTLDGGIRDWKLLNNK